MSNITKEKIDEIFLKATENNLTNINNQFIEYMNNIPDMKNNSVAREIVAASIAQTNVMCAMKEVCYELLLNKDAQE